MAGNSFGQAFRITEPLLKIFDTDKMPTDVGHAFAEVWQGLLDVTRTHAGIKLPIDVNVSGSRSPSEVNASPEP